MSLICSESGPLLEWRLPAATAPSCAKLFTRACILITIGVLFQNGGAFADGNLLLNPGFEEGIASWETRADAPAKASIDSQEAHAGQKSLLIPAHCAVEQGIQNARSGAYLARCWVKSESAQPVSFILQDTNRPWAVYAYADFQLPKGQWTQIEVACALDRDGSLTATLGGLSPEYCIYHGTKESLGSAILADDFELVRCETKTPSRVELWDSKTDLSALVWSGKDRCLPVESQSPKFEGSPVFKNRHLAGTVRKEDGALILSALQELTWKQRGIVTPAPAFKAAFCTLVKSENRTGIRIASESGDRAYTAWLLPEGVVRIESDNIPRFVVQDCRLSYGILPSFVGADICFAPANYPGIKQIHMPSSQWFVGLVEGGDSMMVAVWDAAAQAVSLGLSGEEGKRTFDSLAIDGGKGGFALSFVEHAGLWHREPLQEDWLGEFTPIEWKRPFQARWMGHFFVTPGGEPSFHQPHMDYSFPIANAKTRMWGVWFEDWNYYPFYFDGPRTLFHFEKSFIPNGDVLIYFLEPAAADLYSPCEIVELALGKEKAAALFDFDGNRIRKLKYSTPDQFMYDRPVCATTTRLSRIKKEEKASVGVNLATHLYEFIREIRGRVEQYAAFFGQMQTYLAQEKTAHPELKSYIGEMEALLAEAQSKNKPVFNTPLAAVKAKTDSMIQLLKDGKGDGFDCGTLDVRGPAGAQDDLCRRQNRSVLRLMQTAALRGADSPQKAVIAKNVIDRAKEMLRQPTRWEPRRTLYFSEP
jgi:hypothetical protein